MWCVTDSYFVDSDYGKLIPMMGLEAAFRDVLIRNVGALQRANVMPPYSLTFGAVGIQDYSLAIVQSYDTPYVIRDNMFQDSFVIPTCAPENLNKALGRIYSKFFRMSGFERPANLFGFSAPA